MHIRLLLIATFIFSVSVLGAQKVFQIEKFGSAKTEKFYKGDQFYIQVDGHPGTWEHVEIIDIIVSDSMVLFDKGAFHINQIIAIQTESQRRLGKVVRLSLQNFSLGIMFYSLFDPIVGRDYNWNAPIVAGSSFAVGLLAQLLLNQRYHRIGKRKNLRVLDLNFLENPLDQY